MTGNGTLRAWTDKAALARWCWGVLVLTFLAGGVYVTLDYRVKVAEETGVKNARQIEALKQGLNEVKTKQQVIINQLDNDRRAQDEFRGRTESALDRILNKLDRLGREAR